jgi:O-succinylhomoserine sulfhydrylase
MNNEFGFETQAIRNQLERTQYLEHSVPLYLTSSFVFEDAEDMRASFERKEEYLQPIQQPKSTTNLLAKYALWKVLQLVLPLHQVCAVYSTMAALLNSGIIVSSSSVLVQRILVVY